MTKYEYYTTSPDYASYVWDDWWACQTFTPQISHYISMVKLPLFRYSGVECATVVVGIQKLIDGHPDGVDIASGSFLIQSLPDDDESPIWREVNLSHSWLTQFIEYAIVVRVPNSEKPDVIQWWNSYGTYPRGNRGYSSDAGHEWWMESDYDYPYLFEEWGYVSSPGTEDKVALDLIRNLEMSAGGRAWIDKEGNFHYDSRYGRKPC